MAAELFMVRACQRLAPASAGDEEELSQLAQGVTYRAVLTRAKGRSLQHHNLLFALIKIAQENSDEPLSKEGVLDVLKLRTGHSRVTKLPSGELVIAPASINFASMDQDAFTAWFPRAVDVIARDFLHGADPLSVATEASSRAEGTQRAAA